MRLAYLTTKYPSVSHTFIRRELLEMERRGHDIVRLAIRASDSALVDRLDQAEERMTLHCLSQPVSRLLLATAMTALARPAAFARALAAAMGMGWRSDRGVYRHLAYLIEACFLLRVLRRESVDHVHVHFGTNPADVARLIRRMGGPPYSFTVHGPDEFDAPRQLDLAGKIADAEFVAAISDYGAAQLRRWIPLEHWSKVHVVHCTVGDEFFNASDPIHADSQTFVCVGRLCPQKGQLLLLEAFAEVVKSHPRARLVLAGDGELRQVIERRIKELELPRKVEITGWIDEAEVRRRILAARALVLPSFAEGLPVVIMEALALRRPVISTYVAGIPELVQSGKDGRLVQAGNPVALSEAMKAVLDTPAVELSMLAAHGARRVRTRHNVSTEVGRLEKLILSTVRLRRTPSPGGHVRKPVRVASAASI